jgi:hypothetical protein
MCRMSLLVAALFVGACHAQILIPGHEDEYSSVTGCSSGVCMPTHPLQIFVGAPANREVHVTLLNPHGDDEECDVREEGDRQIATCSYRVVRGFSAPYYFLIVLSRARGSSRQEIVMVALSHSVPISPNRPR